MIGRDTAHRSVQRPPANVAMSIDLEDWFHVENLKSAIPRATWRSQPERVRANTERILELFERTGTVATFFCLGWVAERDPELIRMIARQGHEIAGHGYAHRLVYEQDSEAFRADVVRAKHLLEDIVGSAVIGYRAPSFSITDTALDLLRDAGYRYDSSWFPVGGHDRYGRVDLHRRTVEQIATDRRRCVSAAKLSLDNGLVELPITTLSIGRRVLPWGGGGWFRLYPPRLFRLGFRRAVLRAGGGIFYLHPWEIDPDQPRVTGIPRSHAFRHYVNLDRTAWRLERLCRSVTFGRCDRIWGLRPATGE